ncbi:MAG: hypothetical protein RLZ98_1807 [Pseudomonadota bacterium]
MQVILVNDSSYATGGATKVFLRCIEAALNLGHDVVAFVGDDGEHIRRTYPEVRVVALGERALRVAVEASDIVKKTFNARAMRMLREELAGARDDCVVHVHGWMQILSPSVFRALDRANVPVLVTAHDFFLACPNGAFVDYPTGEVCRRQPLSLSCIGRNCDKRGYLHKLWRAQRTWLQGTISRQVRARATLVLVHEKMADFLDGHGFARTVTLRTPTDAFVAEQVDVASNSRITFLGRMTSEKGVHVLVDALAMIGKPANLLGTGPLLEDVRSKAPGSYCPGWVKEEDVPQLLRQARVFVMPSRMPEPYGLVAAEAMMSGIPVVVSRNSLIAEEVEASGAGLAFESNNAADLARALQRITEDDDLAREMGARAYALGQRFAPSVADWELRLAGLYTEALQNSRAPANTIEATSPIAAE